MKKMKNVKTPAGLSGNFSVLWGERDQPSRGPKPALSADQIARAAVRVADAEGIDAVSMQRIAREVDVTTMALYRYFSNKAELLELMIDVAGGPVPDFGAVSNGWRSRLKEWTRRCSSIYHKHPWFLQAASARRRIMGPNELAWFDTAIAILAKTDLPTDDQHQAFLLLIGYVRSKAEFRAVENQGPSTEQWLSEMTKLLGRHRERYPSLMTALNSGAFSQSRPDDYDFGLECILDGIERAAQKRRKQRSRARHIPDLS